MMTFNKPRVFSAVVAAGALLLQCCACTFTGKPQQIPVTSNPAGAKIIVDGDEKGAAPLYLSLKRDADHVVRIEKPGYDPVEIRLASKSPHGGMAPYLVALIGIPIAGLVGGVVGMALTPEDNGVTFSGFSQGLLIGAAVMSVVSIVSINQSMRPILSPGVLRVTLQKASEQSRPTVLLLNREQSRSIRWIRISCSESGAEGLIDLN